MRRFFLLGIVLLFVTIAIDQPNRFEVRADDDTGRDGYMTLSILPAGAFELKDPLGRRLIHRPGQTDIVEIPEACCTDLAYSEEDDLQNEVYIFSPVGGDYVLKINKIPGKHYSLAVRVSNEGDKLKDIYLENVPIKKGTVHTYDINFDKQTYNVKAVRRRSGS
jgi:hypothetical protein